MEQLFTLFPERIRTALIRAELSAARLQEIRLRIGQPVLLRYDRKEYGITKEGRLGYAGPGGICCTEKELAQVLEYASGYSVYAFSEELRQGFFTIPGGHRIGVAGKVVMNAAGVQEMRNISFLNIRIAHQRIGCAGPVLPYLIQNDVCHTLIISPPGCGKTTLLRDLIRLISDGSGYLPGRTVGVVDERSELAGCYQGVPQNELGMRTDVLDGCRKAEGMQMLLRAMAPEVLAVDEIGNERDRDALEAAFHCGCRLLATAHGNSLSDVKRRPLIGYLTGQGMFERFVILGKGEEAGVVQRILDGTESVLYEAC